MGKSRDGGGEGEEWRHLAEGYELIVSKFVRLNFFFFKIRLGVKVAPPGVYMVNPKLGQRTSGAI